MQILPFPGVCSVSFRDNIYKTYWARTDSSVQHNVTSTHQCVRWDSLMDYAKANTVDVFADGMLVHPELGKSGFPPTRPGYGR